MNGAVRLLVPLTYLGFWIWSLDVLLHDWEAHTTCLPGQEAGLAPLLLISRIVVIVASAAVGVWLGLRDPNRQLATRALQTLFYALPFALVMASVAQIWLPPTAERWMTRSIFLSSLGLAQIVWSLHWAAGATSPSDRVATRGAVLLQLVCTNVVATLVLAEIALTVFATLRPSPLVFRDSVAEHLDAMRQPAHAAFHDGRLNRGGYADDEFFTADRDDLVVAVLADSFGLGIVPLRYNFISVAERALRAEFGKRYARVALHNFGVPAIGLAEYAQLLATEVMPHKPTLVVVCVFVGNDIHEGISFTKAVKERYRLQQWLTWRVTARLLSLARLTVDERERVARIGADGGQPGEAPAWIEDPGLEISTMTESRFLEVETRRRRITDPSDAKIAQGFDQLFAGLRHFHSLLEERLLVVLIPDEFQVNDALWETLGGDAPGLDRTLPQQRILAFCTDRDIECLDLLPVLRAAEPSGRTYHLRDTHWNARGNLAAGSALARAIADELQHERGLGKTKTATR